MKLNFCYVRELCEMSENGRQRFSAADEILKYKSLLDMGAITQEEFDLKKEQLLSLPKQLPETENGNKAPDTQAQQATEEKISENQEKVNKEASMWLLGSALESIGGCLGTLGTVCIIITIVVLIILFL